jgi:hypothetical protein
MERSTLKEQHNQCCDRKQEQRLDVGNRRGNGEAGATEQGADAKHKGQEKDV